MPISGFAALPIPKLIGLTAVMALGLTNTHQGIQVVYESAREYGYKVVHARAPHFSHAPFAANIGQNPGKDRNRGIWTDELRKRAASSSKGENLWASIFPVAQIPPTHTEAVADASGAALPWEGKSSAQGANVNTGNGDRLTEIPLFSWKTRGGGSIGFSLFHNSETNYNDELGNGWTWTYDIYINNLTGSPIVHWGDGTAVPFTAGKGGSGFTAPAGFSDKLVKNSNSTWTLSKKDQTVYNFNAAGFCSTIVDRNGNTTTLSYNPGNYATQITDPTGRTITFALDANNHFTGVTDAAGRTWTFTLNGSDDLTTVTWPANGDGNTYTDQFAYDGSHHIATHTDRRGYNWTATYNSDGSVATTTDPLSHTTTYGYTTSATTVTDPLGHSQVDNYSSGLLASSVDKSGFSVNYTARDSNYNPTSVTDQRGHVWGYTYDSLGNELTLTDPLGHTKTFTYNGFAEPLTKKDALGNTTTDAYDSHGNLLTETDPLGHVAKTVGYDSYGEATSVKDALGNVTTLGYDGNGDLNLVGDATGRTQSSTLGTLGQVLTTIDPAGNLESALYDGWLRPSRVTHADGSYASTAYDGIGDVVALTDENGHTTAKSYDPTGRLKTVTNPRGDVESCVYDAQGHRISTTNANGKTQSYTFTYRGEMASLTMPDGAVEQWTFDGCGNTTAYTNPLVQMNIFGFDAANRATSIAYPSGTGVTFAYDSVNRRTSMTDATGATSCTFDAASRVTGLTTPQGSLTYGYDNANRRTSMLQPAGTTTYTYDGAGRLLTLDNGFGETTTWAYDAGGRPATQTFANGQVDSFGYDVRNRETSVVHSNSSGSALSSESYVYDGVGNLGAKTVDGIQTTYSYDQADQILSESRTGYTTSYSYDANGNRLTRNVNGVAETYSYDNGDKLQSVTSSTGNKSYGYDAAGRTTSVTTSAGVTSLTYDYESRVTGITYPSGATNSFVYNGLDTRVGKTDSGGAKAYLRDGADVTAPVVADTSATYTPGVSLHNSSGTTYQLADYLGSVNRQSSSSQSLTSTRTYDAFGAVVSSTGSPTGPFGFVGNQGYQEDGDSGLQLLGHRYYDASTGRFLSRDLMKDGRNWYQYCANNPLSDYDATGQQAYRKGGWPNHTNGYPVGPHYDPDPFNHHGGPHIDFPNRNTGKNDRETFGEGWEPPERDPITGKMPGDKDPAPTEPTEPAEPEPAPFAIPPMRKAQAETLVVVGTAVVLGLTAPFWLPPLIAPVVVLA